MGTTLATTSRRTPLTRNQVRGFWAAWGGWALDGMDSFIYALVLVPALTELLPALQVCWRFSAAPSKLAEQSHFQPAQMRVNFQLCKTNPRQFG